MKGALEKSVRSITDLDEKCCDKAAKLGLYPKLIEDISLKDLMQSYLYKYSVCQFLPDTGKSAQKTCTKDTKDTTDTTIKGGSRKLRKQVRKSRKSRKSCKSRKSRKQIRKSRKSRKQLRKSRKSRKSRKQVRRSKK